MYFKFLRRLCYGVFTESQVTLDKAACFGIEVSTVPSVKIGLSDLQRTWSQNSLQDMWMSMSAAEKNNTSIFKLVGILKSNPVGWMPATVILNFQHVYKSSAASCCLLCE